MFRTVVTTCLVIAFVACGAGDQNAKRKRSKRPRKAVSADALLRQAIAAQEDGKPARAEKKYKRALRKRPTHFETVKRFVRFYIAQRQAKKAVAIAAAYHKRKLDDDAGSHLLADANIKAGNYKAAFNALNEILDLNEKDGAAYEKRGNVQVLFAKYTKGIEDLQKAVQLDPENRQFRVSLGSGLQQANRLNEAAIELRKVLQLDKENARAHLILGIVLRKNTDIREAYYHHLRAVKFAPQSSRAHFELGITQNARGDNPGSETSLAMAVKLDPHNATNWYAYGEISRYLKKWGRALNAYKQALKLDPKHRKVKSKLAVVLYYMGQYERSEVILTEEIHLRPNKAHPYFNLGLVYSAQKKYGMAIGALHKFIKLAPKGDGDLKEARKKIKWIRKQM